MTMMVYVLVLMMVPQMEDVTDDWMEKLTVNMLVQWMGQW